MDDLEELKALRRMAELEAKTASPVKSPMQQLEAIQPSSQTKDVAPLTWAEKMADKLPDSIKHAIGAAEPASRSFVMGAADPIVGAAQLGAHVANSISPQEKTFSSLITGKSNSLADKMDAAIEAKEKQYQESRGDTGFDALRMAGNIASPASLLPMSRLAAPATMLGRIGQGAAVAGAYGATSPNAEGGNDYAEQQLQKAALAAALGAAAPAGWEGAKALGRVARNLVAPMTENGLQGAVGRMANINAGEKTDAIIALLKNYKPPASGAPLTAGQVAAPANSAEFSAMQQLGENANGSLYRGEKGVNDAQANARAAYLDTIAQKGTNVKQELIDALVKKTIPDREQAMANANLAGVLTPKLEAAVADKYASKVGALQTYGQLGTESLNQQALANKILDKTPYQASLMDALKTNPTVKYYIESLSQAERAPFIQSLKNGETNAVNKMKNLGYSGDVRALRNQDRGAEDAGAIAQQRQSEMQFRKMQLDSIAGEGFTPLKTNQLTEPLDKLLSTPGPEASDMLQKSIGAVNEKFKALSKDGVIDARNLDTIRKELGTTIKKAIMNPDGTWDAKWATGQEIKIKKTIDEAINKASGNTQYTDSLSKYAEGMKVVNDVTIARELQKALVAGTGQERKAAFMNAVENASQSPDMLRKSGAARYGNIDQAMTQRGQDVKNNLMSEFGAQRNFEDLARGGMSEATKNLGVAMPVMSPTGMLNPKLSIARALINRVVGKEHGSVLKSAGKETLDPQNFAKIMQDAKPYERQAMVDALMKYQAAAVGQQH